MIISEAYAEQLKDSLVRNPLVDGEMRRIEGMGALYVSLTSDKKNESVFEFLYSYWIEGTLYYFYSGPELKNQS